MIEYIIKDITTVTFKDGVVLHGCNTSGVAFSSGLAGAIRKKWPHAYKSYKENGGGAALLGGVDILIQLLDDIPVIVNGYTQINYGRDGKCYADPDAIESVLNATAEFMNGGEYKELYMPKIGCGLGGLSWEDNVLPIVVKVSSEFPKLNIHICDI